MIGFLKPAELPRDLSCLARTYHCGLCRTIKETYGTRYSLFAGPDLVFFNIFLDAAAAQNPAVVPGHCIILPRRLSHLRARSRTEHARFTAAFGVAMAVAKLDDNYEDEGGFFRWLAWRFFRSGGERARADLTAMGFDVGKLDAWMARQAEIENGDNRALDEAAVPTTRIAQLLFARARLSAGAAASSVALAIGECVGRFLFYVDNLLDFFDDVRGGQYNALARAFDVKSVPKRLPLAVASAGLAGALAQVEALAPLVAQLPPTPQRDYVDRVLQHGFRYKLERFEALAVTEGKRPSLFAISRPARPPWYRQLHRPFVTTWQIAVPQLKLAVFFLAWVLAPRSARAAQWMASVQAGDAGQPDGGTPPANGCDAACQALCGDPCHPNCGDACNAACGAACDPVCNPDCGNTCTPDCGSACNPDCNPTCSGR